MVKLCNKNLSCDVNLKVRLKRHVPIIDWLPSYTVNKLFHDLLAGLTVALTEVPQSLAYAAIAGLDLHYGLYSGYMGIFVYLLFGSCKDINVGPTGLLSLMIQPSVQTMGADGAVLMTLISGIIIFTMGILHLGFVVEFFSYPVIAGFTSAAAIQTGSAQLRSLLGISGQGSEFLDSWITVIENIRKVRIGDTILGICTVVFLLVVKYVCSSGSSKSDPQKTKTQNVMSLFFWLFSLTRYALAVIFGAVLAFTLSQYDRMPFVLTGNVERGLPGFSVPNFGTTYNNETFSFIQMISNYDSSIVFIPMISILEHISIAKAFAQGKTIDGTQEMLALGMCNIASSFVRSMPITGSFTRTAVNNQSGVKTTFAGFFTGCLVLMSLGFITSFFYYIPKATLAAVVISAMVNLVEFKAVPILWRSKKTDVIPFLVTLLTSLLWNLEYGIIVGIVVNIFFILYKSARPSIKIETKLVGDINVYLVEPTTNLQFPSAEFLKESVLAQCDASISFIIIDGKNMESIDATVAKNLKALIDNLKIRKQTIIFWNFREKVVKVCINLDKSMDGYFFQGSLSNVIEEFQGANPNQKRGNDLDQA